MATIIRCDRCKKETNAKRTIKLPDKESEFDFKNIDLCKDCVESMKHWLENP